MSAYGRFVAFSSYVDTVPQRFLLTLRSRRTTWQIDPFGHSAFQALLSSPLAGANGVYVARMVRNLLYPVMRRKEDCVLWRCAHMEAVTRFVALFGICDAYP